MIYIDYNYYVSDFGGSIVPENQFDYLSSAASEIISSLMTKDVVSTDTCCQDVEKAISYQTETLCLQGGAEAIAGLASSTCGLEEKLGDYSVGSSYNSLSSCKNASYHGIPVSGIAISVLSRAGLMNRCFFSE